MEAWLMKGYWRHFYLLHPTEGGGGDGGSSDGGDDGAGGDDGDDGDDEDGSDEQPKKKFVSLDRHRKVKSKLTQATSENTRLKQENEELKGKVSASEIKDKKSEAIAKAKKELKDVEFDPDKEDLLQKTVGALVYDEKTFDATVAELVQGFTKPVASSKSIVGKRPSGAEFEKDPMSYNGKELGVLSKEDPDLFQEVMKARKTALIAKRAEKKK
jgi:hypothetical protein